MNAQILSFNCLLKNSTGQLISSTYNREVLTTVDDEKAMLLGLAKGLQNIKKGEKRTIILSAKEAYGFYDPQKIILYPRSQLSRDIRVGSAISIMSKSGVLRSYKVVEMHGNMVSLDGNHPLAGQDLIFEIDVLEAREATRDEVDESLNMVGVQLLH